MKQSVKNENKYNFIVCKHDLSPMTFNKSDLENVGVLKCNVCEEQYLVVRDIILTDYNLMSDEDRSLEDQISKNFKEKKKVE